MDTASDIAVTLMPYTILCIHMDRSPKSNHLRKAIYKYLISAHLLSSPNPMHLYSEKMEELKRVAEQHRLCPPWDRCESFPCQHSSYSTDEDYLADLKDKDLHPELHRTAWSLFHNPSQKQSLSSEELEKYSMILARYERITAKRPQIRSEIKTNHRMFMEEVCGFPPEEEIHLSEEEFKAVKEDVKAKLMEDFQRCAVEYGWST